MTASELFTASLVSTCAIAKTCSLADSMYSEAEFVPHNDGVNGFPYPRRPRGGNLQDFANSSALEIVFIFKKYDISSQMHCLMGT